MTTKPKQTFVPAESIKKEFEVLGDYYISKGRRSRRLLVIRRRATGRAYDPASTADALVVMMNPGGSKPLAGFNNPTKGLVAAKPDITQYQIMRLMQNSKWNLVRVINLSDLIEPKSTIFIKMFGKASQDHSIFSSSRKGELDQLISSSGLVLCAWGCNKQLLPLSSQAVSALPSSRQGLMGSALHSYRHPLPRGTSKQLRWLEDTFNQLAT